MNLLKRYVNDERKGATTFEWTITSPVLLGLLFIVMFMLMFILSYANYGALASDVASSMNFRQTGITNAKAAVHGGNNGLLVRDKQGNYLAYDKITVNGNAGRTDFKDVVVYYMNQNANKVYFPFAEMNNVSVDTFRMNNANSATRVNLTSNMATASNFANVLVKVNVNYRFMPINFMGWQWPGMTVNVAGYSVLT